MENIYKVGLAVIDDKHILLLRKKESTTFILPGGRYEGNENDEEALRREIKEELTCDIDFSKLTFVGKYADKAANEPNKIININLYIGPIEGNIKLDNEIEEYVWFNPHKAQQIKLADSIKNKILPALIERGNL
jgi:8-oxo-dGTP diphosphatase